ncbi:MAG: F0F1 ATP synthase subunit delta [Hyphomicrobiaceae bacterium]
MAGDDNSVTGVAGRYASALFDLARETNAVDQILTDLKGFETMLGESRDLERLVRSPVFSADEQARALDQVLAKAGMTPLTRNFFGLLARNRRLFVAGDIVKAFKALVAAMRRQVSAEVTSAVPLGADQIKALTDTLKASVGRDVQLTAKVDPAILGGLVVKVGSRMIDSSLKTKLNNLKFAMKEVR